MYVYKLFEMFRFPFNLKNSKYQINQCQYHAITCQCQSAAGQCRGSLSSQPRELAHDAAE
jgi:hypothetical protein